MFNLYTAIVSDPKHRRYSCGESLLTVYNCGLQNKFHDLWSQHNYIVYVVEGRKTWHTPHGSFDLRKGDCVFVQKGAAIVEQFFDTAFCLFLFFLPDEFICEVLKEKSRPIKKTDKSYAPIINIQSNRSLDMYFQLMMTYFDGNMDPDEKLLELKFKELILTVADNPANNELRCFFASLLKAPQSVSLSRVMEDNFSFNLSLKEFATLSSRSLSAFKRDFQKQFNTTPGKWLMEKRLNYAKHLLTNLGKTVSEAAFESGFEDRSHFSRAFRKQFGESPVNIKQHVLT
jgi:AraC family transcriptional regulator, exoenzyme S synthesis regulatory protein ExsA